ncbi:hypothetical protein TNCV_2781151 [Trichonephila clavipes]|nr:hypothetical protein TNCV_2781151 [Trichonephila clavipes]
MSSKNRGSEYNTWEEEGHNHSLRSFPTDFCPLQGFGMEQSPLYPQIASDSWAEWDFLTFKGCRGDDRRQGLAIFRSARVHRKTVILSTKGSRHFS